jgi:GTPase
MPPTPKTSEPAPAGPARAESPAIRRAGFVGIVGRPNVGKSTLLNQILGEKLAIATPRPQTTRNRLLAVKHVGDAQLALVDTPGLHRPGGPGRTALNRFMLDEALSVLSEVDVVLLLTDSRSLREGPEDDEGRGGKARKAGPPAGQGQGALTPGDRFAAETLKGAGKPVLLAVNKIDLMRDRRRMLPLMDAWSQALAPAAVVPISARTGDGVDRLLGELCALLPEGPALFPEEMLTDRAERWIAAEFVREQVFLATRDEVPYAVAVTIDAWEDRSAPRGRRRPGAPADGERSSVVVSATIHVEKEAQKKIVVGEGGRMVRDIGTQARAEIGQLLGCPVHLELFVRVDPRWSQSPAKLREMGYDAKPTKTAKAARSSRPSRAPKPAAPAGGGR